MDAKGQFGLTYTEDFRIACEVNYFKQKEVLQYFINRVSFYAFNGGEMEAAALWATQILLDCKNLIGGEVIPLTNRKVKRIAIKYIFLLNDLNENTYLSTVDKMKESFCIMQEWEAEMLPLVDYPRTFYLNEEIFLVLTFDFNLICRMNGLQPQQVLQYFIDQISVARQRALNLIDFAGTNSCMSLFSIMQLSRSMKQKKLPAQKEIEAWFTQQLLALDETLRDEPDIDSRVATYRELYAEWCHTLRRNLE
ncbi:hypothetical protein [Pedobacter hartonius]|uniref:Uncharacterized protein n=1 Tax=Pedobacter hartonius TaxID=425514 RepID=A0A1H4GRZ2_9SPHI|nr:hypothetical protein [Pedobacter hartonius]SEB12287.1 hypothetical protein SAMN05443550_11154 [Pedobacter hartonius]